MGYFLLKSQLMIYNGLKYNIMQFEPLFQENIRDKISKDGMLYHITPSKNIETIKEKGFIPSWQNKEFKYPNRVYFFIDGYNVTQLRDIARGLKNTSYNENDEPYSLMILNLYKVNKNVSFHYEPNFLNAVYTYDAVNSSAIVTVLDLKI